MKKLLLILLLIMIIPSRVMASEDYIWEVRSVDTMKTSRDLAREKLHDISYDQIIVRDLKLIKDLGANYVAIDTPYDEEFIPYLTRWVKHAREQGLKVWFRGNFSEWEGWFGYPKNMTPQEHIRRTAQFIESHSDIFEDGDAFDPCPECENAQWWPQPDKNSEYNSFVINQQVITKASFAKIGKDVHTNWTGIIGGRAKEVLDQRAVDALDKVVAIDHYTNSVANMDDYIRYFADSFDAKTLISEFGAPIPDINGKMSEAQQADFIDSMMNIFYVNKDKVYGINYFALGTGTTEIIDAKGKPKLAYEVIKKYYSPAKISGEIRDELGQAVAHVKVTTDDGIGSAETNRFGEYSLVVPGQNTTLTISNKNYHTVSHKLSLSSGEQKEYPITLKRIDPSIIYQLRLWLILKLHSK